MSDNKAEVEEFIKMHQRGMEACEKAATELARAGFTVGEISLGCLYLLDFQTKEYPLAFITAERVMAAYRGLKKSDGAVGGQPQEV